MTSINVACVPFILFFEFLVFRLMRPLMFLAGSILLLLGLISMLTPIPGGTLAITVGAGLLICSSEKVANFIRHRRIKFSRFNRIVTWLEDKIGPKLSRPLRLTRPDEQQPNTEPSERVNSDYAKSVEHHE